LLFPACKSCLYSLIHCPIPPSSNPTMAGQVLIIHHCNLPLLLPYPLLWLHWVHLDNPAKPPYFRSAN
jgi:hypothetical protein